MAECGAESSWKNEFPLGMRVLAVDDDRVCLRLLETQLKECGYQVTATQHALTALELLRENKDNYDIVISDVQMPDMDGFKLLEIIGLEMDLPVIMLSVKSETSYVMKGVLHGAVDYLVKPVRLEDLKLIWKHVIKKSLLVKKESNDPSNTHIQKQKADNDRYSITTRKSMDKIKEKEDSAHENSDGEPSKQKRQRVSWSADLHTHFVKAVNHLGFDRAVPKKILDLMNVKGLTRENIASHLQKYRKTLKRNGIGLQRQHCGGPHPHGFGVNSPGPSWYTNSSVAPSPFQHFASFPQAGHFKMEQDGYSSNSMGTERAYPLSGFKNLTYQSLRPTLDQVECSMKNFHQNSLIVGGISRPDSSSQLHHPPNENSFETLLENNNAGLDASAKLNPVMPSLDMSAQSSRDMLDMQIYDGDTFEDTFQSEFAKHQPEDSSIESLFFLDKCNSMDDLNTVLKQFQQQ
ncbi:two-component response regulator ARR10-like isoform X5 [Musa acuminata AAA Group]|uniref:two-component response regulator ARR10-like isoform X5 n=1 Tax=Musa acuminata AAA Group TaxID=214697 RepID=UPI0031D26A73